MRIFILIMLLGIFTACKDRKQTIDCEKFREGNFTFNTGTGTTYTIERTGRYQSEYNPLTDTIAVYEIKWTGNCEYEMRKRITGRKTELDTMRSASIKRIPDTVPFKVRITGGQDDYYTFEIRKEGFSRVLADTMWINKKIGGFKSMGGIYHQQGGN